MKANYDRTLAPLMLQLDTQPPTLAQTAQPLLTVATDNPNDRKDE
jgi:hypothetical protein